MDTSACELRFWVAGKVKMNCRYQHGLPLSMAHMYGQWHKPVYRERHVYSGRLLQPEDHL